MNLPYDLFAPGWHVAAAVLSLLALAFAALGVRWRELLHSGARRNALLGFAVIMTLLWSLRAGVLPGLNLHLLGAMAACLMFGPCLALFALAAALTGITLNGAVEWAAWPINLVVMGLIPVLCAQGLRALVDRWLPSHFFIYVFVLSFAGSALVVMLTGLAASVLLWTAGAYAWSQLAADYLPYFLLLGFSEAWISGAVLTMMLVYRPEWVHTFDDGRYLRR